jgi:acetolactate synthase-1/2/3 large subunit
MTMLIWHDDVYGLIRWKMGLGLSHDVITGFSVPDFVACAESFGARGARATSAGDLLPALTDAVAADVVGERPGRSGRPGQASKRTPSPARRITSRSA